MIEKVRVIKNACVFSIKIQIHGGFTFDHLSKHQTITPAGEG